MDFILGVGIHNAKAMLSEVPSDFVNRTIAIEVCGKKTLWLGHWKEARTSGLRRCFSDCAYNRKLASSILFAPA